VVESRLFSYDKIKITNTIQLIIKMSFFDRIEDVTIVDMFK